MNESGIFIAQRVNEILLLSFFIYSLKKKFSNQKSLSIYPVITGVMTGLSLGIYVFTHTRKLLISWNQEDLLGKIFLRSYNIYLLPVLEGLIVGIVILLLTKRNESATTDL
jgi:hypothetical protein